MVGVDERAMMAHVQERVASAFPQVSQDKVQSIVGEIHARFADSRVRDFVPLLVEKRAQQELARVLPHPRGVAR